MRQLLPDINQHWPKSQIRPYKREPFQLSKPNLTCGNDDEIVHEYFWHKLSDFIPENSIVVAETGTSEFGKGGDVC
jgi:TPP-dependent 2-oxoacid decarboxylase